MKIEVLSRNLSRAEESLDEERRNVQQLSLALKEEKIKTGQLEQNIVHLKDTVKDCESQLFLQKERVINKNKDEDNFRNQLKVIF